MKRFLLKILNSPNGEYRRPILRSHFESTIRGLFVVGDLAGASVVKMAMQQGHDVAHHIAGRVKESSAPAMPFDLIIAGAGAAGLNCALEAQALGLKVLVIEKNKIANTIEEFPEGKWIYAEPEGVSASGRLWLEASSKEELLARWHADVSRNGLDVRTGEGIEAIARHGGGFEVRTPARTYRSKFVVLATGQRANARKLGVPGEDRPRVAHQLYSAKHHTGEDIVVVGGGNSAVEAAIALAERNRVTLSYRGKKFTRVFAENRRRLAESSVRVIFESNVERFDDGACVLDPGDVLAYDYAFVLIGADPPAAFLRSLGLKLENEWTPGRYAALVLSLAIVYTIFAVKQAPGHEYWPFRGWGAHAFAFFNRPWSFWSTVLYTLAVTVFGLQAMKRWGIDRKDKFQMWRYGSLIGFQWTFFFILPEFLFRYLVGPNHAWRAYGLVYAWPLFFNTFFYTPNRFWIYYGLFLSFLLIPLLTLCRRNRA